MYGSEKVKKSGDHTIKIGDEHQLLLSKNNGYT